MKANISNRIVFHTESEKDSVICLDEVGAETLDIKGRGILKVGSNKTVFQGFYVSDDEVKEYIKPYVVNKKAVEPVVVSNNGNTIFDKYKDFKPGFIENKKNDNVEDAEDLKDLSFLKNI
ncbi:Stage III sporulation protein E [uncultured Clostridium sp.]|nr:Stage III sporulation protein E [uncultured Clostridium sp.]